MRCTKLAALVSLLLLFAAPMSNAHAALEMVFAGSPAGVFSITDTDGFVPDADIDFAPGVPIAVDIVFNPSAPPSFAPGVPWDFGVGVFDLLPEVTIAAPVFFVTPGIVPVSPPVPLDPFGGFAGLFIYTGAPVVPSTVIASFTIVPAAPGLKPHDELTDLALFSGTGAFGFPGALVGVELIEDHLVGGPLPIGVGQGFDAQTVVPGIPRRPRAVFRVRSPSIDLTDHVEKAADDFLTEIGIL